MQSVCIVFLIKQTTLTEGYFPGRITSEMLSAHSLRKVSLNNFLSFPSPNEKPVDFFFPSFFDFLSPSLPVHPSIFFAQNK